MILITGATGLIGSYIARLFVQKGEKVKLLLRPNTDTILINDFIEHSTIAYGDILDTASLYQAMQEVQCVLHCAAIVSFGEVSEHDMYMTNVEGTKNIVNTCIEVGVHSLIYLSSVAALGRTSANEVIDETAKWEESGYNSAYARSKYLAELEVWRGIHEGLRAAMLNPTVVLGPGNWNRSSTKIFKNLYKGIMYYPTGSTNVVDVRDVAQAAWILYTHKVHSERYIIHAHTISYYDLFCKVAEVFGNDKPYLRISKYLMLSAYYVLKIFAPYFLKKRYINRETIIIASSHYSYDNTKFIKQFGMTYRTVDDSIMWCCQELNKSNKKLNIE
ncbi:MAG: NAD-dependent epimerase/dehydratase family protein [Cytophagales bacterium]|nr:NAD-dependent epimerase/dehydratase family protein [Cytophagales bacterium]